MTAKPKVVEDGRTITVRVPISIRTGRSEAGSRPGWYPWREDSDQLI